MAVELATKSGSQYAKALAFKNLGLYYMYVSEYSKSYEFLDSSLTYYKSINDTDGIGRIYNNIGLNYMDESKYLDALEAMEKSLAISRQLNDSIGCIVSLNNIGIVYNNLLDTKRAKEKFLEAIQIANQIHDEKEKISSYINMVDIAYYEKDTTTAKKYLDEAIILSKQIGDSLSLYECYDSKAYYENIAGNLTDALAYNNKSIEFFKSNNLVVNYTNSLIIKSDILIKSGNTELAEQFLLEAYRLADSIKYNNYIYDAASSLEKHFANLNQYDKAYKFQKVVTALKDTFNTQINNKQLAQKEYELNLKQAQSQFDIEAEKQKLQYENQLNKERIIKNTFFIVLLFSFVLILLGFKTANSRKRINNELMAKTAIISEKQELLNQQNAELANLTEVQSKTLSIISHDIRGPLNSLKGILSYLEHGLVTPEEFESYIKRINAQLERNFILFDNLLKWASSQMKGVSINYERFNIVHVINDNIATYQFIADEKNITLNAETLNDGFISADKDLVSLVFRNLLSNAIKYSFENSTITIKCLAENNKVSVQVSDQGVGIPENLITEIFKLKSNSSDGTNNEKGTGLGLYFCKYAIEKNNGKLWVESKVNEGSTFYFELDTV